MLKSTGLNDIPSNLIVNLPDGPHELEIFFTGDHMLHYKLGECDAPTSSARGKFLCPYCPAPVKEVHTGSLRKRRKVIQEVKEETLLPHLDRFHRVPDLLHCVGNVTKFF